MILNIEYSFDTTGLKMKFTILEKKALILLHISNCYTSVTN